MIDGVKIKELKVIPDERGRLFEILRRDDEFFEQFGQVYITTTYPGVVKAWHLHKEQDDFVCSLTGMIKLALYDPREGSSTNSEINEFFLGEYKPQLIKIPKNVYHGWKCISDKEAMVLNCPTKPYNHDKPDEYRLPPDTDRIAYDWLLPSGKKHG